MRKMLEDFFKNAANLKNVSRQGWIDKLGIKDVESVADHTYSMAIMGMVFSDLEKFNSEKILKMILLHDLAESKIGDFTPNQIDKQKKKQLENDAFDEIIKNLPESIRTIYHNMWNEYQEQESQEAKFVHQIDRLEMALQAKIYLNKGHLKKQLESFFESAKHDITEPKLKELFTKIVEE